MKVLDLFSGIGGFSLGLERAGMETVAFCEIEDYPVKILNKHWPDVPVFRDVRKLNKKVLINEVSNVPDIIVGGFPCQPFSVAGKQKGKEDDRHLWPEMFRLIKEIRPRWVIGENVAGFIRMALDDVLSDLESEGYRCQAFVIPACAVNAIHRRDRVWIVAYSSGKCGNGGEFGKYDKQTPKRKAGISDSENAPNTNNERLQGQSITGGNGEVWQEPNDEQPAGRYCTQHFRPIPIPTQSPVRHRDDGLSDNVARLKALGNAVVPQIPEIIGRAIMEIEA